MVRMKDIIEKLWKNSTKREKAVFYLLVLMMIVSANLELLGIGLILPVVALLTNPELIQQNFFLRLLSEIIRPSSTKSFLLILCGMIAAVYLLKNAFLMILTSIQTRSIYAKVSSLAVSLFRTYVFAPYSFYLKRNTSELLSHFGMINNMVNGILISLLMLFTELINVFLIFVMLFFFTPLTTLLMLVAAVAFSCLIYFPLRKYNLRLGTRHYEYSNTLIRNYTQTFHGIKEIKIRGAEQAFMERNKHFTQEDTRVVSLMYQFAQLPRFLIESGMVLGAMLILVVYILTDMASTSIVLKVSLIGASMVRLMPAMSRIQYNLTTLRQLTFSMDQIFDDLKNTPREELKADGPPMSLDESISVEDVSFSYDGGKSVFSHYSLQIPVNTSTAFVGKTGCGKTTLVDIIAGLLEPSEGRILSDGRDIRENLYSWRRMIGYVPQFIYILDDSILANITFGLPPGEIHRERVVECLKMAQLYDFVMELPQGLDTIVGEAGLRMSGGQRQRLGIARALYRNPKILILDEATSSLDNETEKAFIEAIAPLHGKLTILVIAHRLTTTAGCDRVIDLGK